MRTLLLSLGLLLGCVLAHPLAHAHPLTPAALLLEERADGSFDVVFRRSQLAANHLEVVLPDGCESTPPARSNDGDQLVDRAAWRCSSPLEGRTVHVVGLAELSIGCIVHVERRDGESVRALLTAEQASFVVPARTTALSVLSQYVTLGVDHLITGLDHVLFVIGLLWLVSGVRRVLLTLTAFTLGHSVTLCASALSLVSLPQAPVEIGIALSLVVLALEILERATHPNASTWEKLFGRPWVMALSFGLLHGFGFAGALAETGLPEREIPLALFGFNVGVELGQIVIVLVALPVLALARKLGEAWQSRVRWGFAYGIGSLAAMWCIERSIAAWA